MADSDNIESRCFPAVSYSCKIAAMNALLPDFQEFPKIPRLSRECVITEKIDGTNAQVYIDEQLNVFAGSRNRWITPGKTTDNYGFALWAEENADSLRALGPGTHYGEWYGRGIGRGYGLQERRWALFNVAKWGNSRPSCCDVVPVLWRGTFNTTFAYDCIEDLKKYGSKAVPGFMKPEGIVIFHVAGNLMFKKTVDGDEKPKSI